MPVCYDITIHKPQQKTGKKVMVAIKEQLVDELKRIVPEPNSALFTHGFLPHKNNDEEAMRMNMNYLKGFVEGYLRNAMHSLTQEKNIKIQEASQICIEIRDWAFENWKIPKN